MITELLHLLGVSGSAVLVVSVALTLYHGRTLFAVAARIGSWLRFAGIGALLSALAYSGLIPGVKLNVDFETFSRFVGWLWSMVPVGLDDVVRWLPV